MLKPEDRAWFEAMVHSLGPRALRFAYMQVGSVETAEDIVQDAFAKVWISAKTPRAELEFKRWLYRCVANLAVDHQRRESRRCRPVAMDERSIESDEAFEQVLARNDLLVALQRLPIRDRQLLYLRYFEDLSLRDCARVLGLNPIATRVSLIRALAKLKGRLSPISSTEVAKDAS